MPQKTEIESETLPPANFQLHQPFPPAGDQPTAIEQLTRNFLAGRQEQVLLGATGTGKTFTMANVIANVRRPAIVLSHNKTLAAQLYGEFKEFFPAERRPLLCQRTTTTTSRRPTSRSGTSTSKKIRRSTRRSTDYAWPRPARWSARRDVRHRRVGQQHLWARFAQGVQEPRCWRSTAATKIRRDHMLLRIGGHPVRAERHQFERGKFRVRGDSIELWPSTRSSRTGSKCGAMRSNKISLIKPVSGETIKTLDDALHLSGTPLRDAGESHSRRDPVDQGRVEPTSRNVPVGQGKLLEAQRLVRPDPI